jgi:two-component system cell cycle response regulator DivK
MSRGRSPNKVPAAGAAPTGRIQSGSGPWRFDITGPRKRPTVLIVDDDDDTRKLYGWCMRAAGWIVEEAGDGEQALLKAVGCDPDVIVLDLRMPNMDGVQVLRLLRQSASLSFVPVVLCTVCTGHGIEESAREAGCAAFVAKPCDPDALRRVVESVLSTQVVGRG